MVKHPHSSQHRAWVGHPPPLPIGLWRGGGDWIAVDCAEERVAGDYSADSTPKSKPPPCPCKNKGAGTRTGQPPLR